MQVLLNVTLPPNTPQEQLNLYTTACSRLLEKLGSTPLPVVWEDHLREISTIFADLARILNDNAIVSLPVIHPRQLSVLTCFMTSPYIVISTYLALQSLTYTIIHYSIL